MISSENKSPEYSDPAEETVEETRGQKQEAQAENNANSSAQNEISDEQRKLELEHLKSSLYIRELETKVKNYESKLTDIRDYVKKMETEIENIRLRSSRDAQRTVDQRIGEFLISLLNISDNFDLSVKTAEGDQSPLAQGVRMIHSQLANFLQQAGLVRMSPKGEVFDPHQHEAISMQPTDIKEMDNVVMHEVKGGYRFKDAILRPAQVVVGRFQSSEDSNSASSN